jgi:hypothetical protein
LTTIFVVATTLGVYPLIGPGVSTIHTISVVPSVSRPLCPPI